MFGSSNKSKRNTEIDSLVGGNTKICGDVHFTGGLHVDGVIEGNVIAGSDNSVLTTSEKGQINGNVTVHNIVLNGEVIGDVHALRHIELAPNARVTGNVYYNVIEMAMGAEVNGNLIHTKNGEKSVSNVTQAATEALDPQLPMDKVVNK
jgi:cytoskeletal protein CcmA (bactofilin family)